MGRDIFENGQVDLQRLLLDTFIEEHFEGTKIPVKVSALVSRQQIALLLAAITHRLAESHSRKVLHGDLKPDNILLGASGIELIDGFNVTEGELWPGWTPNWAAPEQILGEPANVAADLYPIGRMIARMLGGHLVGEVRKFRARPAGRGAKDEFDVFYNPSVFIDGPSRVASSESLGVWRSLACECLRFAPQDRPQSAQELGDRILAIATSHPLRGQVRIPIRGDLHMATLPDGSQAVVSMLEDAPAPAKTGSGVWAKV